MDNTILIQALVGLVLFAAGLGIGRLTNRGDARAKARVEELESELATAQKDLEGYRAQVEKHFEKTSRIFRDLTDQYSALYGHLADGARNLCPDGGPALGLGLNDPLLETGDLLVDDETLGEADSAPGDDVASAPEEPTGDSPEATAEAAPEETEPAPEPSEPAAEKPVAASAADKRAPLEWEDLVDEGALPTGGSDEGPEGEKRP